MYNGTYIMKLKYFSIMIQNNSLSFSLSLFRSQNIQLKYYFIK
jgi:hypothetical protein